MRQSLQGATFHVEHVVPTSKGGATTADNLAWCCPSCNLHKGDRTKAADPESGISTPFFNPRKDIWDTHFIWRDRQATGRTPTGRATAAALRLNTERRLRIRLAESRFDLFPP